MFIFFVMTVVLIMVAFFLIKNHYQHKKLTKHTSKIEFELVHERQKNQALEAELAVIIDKMNGKTPFLKATPE